MRPCPLQESAKNRQQTTGMRRGCLSAGRFMMLKNKIKSQRGAAAPQRQACGRARNKSRLYPLCSHHLMYPQQCTIVTPLKSRLYPLCSHHLTYPQQCTHHRHTAQVKALPIVFASSHVPTAVHHLHTAQAKALPIVFASSHVPTAVHDRHSAVRCQPSPRACSIHSQQISAVAWAAQHAQSLLNTSIYLCIQLHI